MYSIQDVEELKIKILDNCPHCQGKGRYMTAEGLVLCSCISNFRHYIDMLGSNIPKSFWDLEFKFDYFTPEFLKENQKYLDIINTYALKLPEVIKTGTGLYLCGSYGVGKSFIGCLLLKKALEQKYKVYFILLSELINLAHKALRDDKTKDFINYIVEDIDFLLLDEINKKYDTKLIDSMLDELFKKRYYSNKPFIVTSNDTPEKVLEGFGKSIYEIFSEKLITVSLMGESFRPEILKGIKKDLLGGKDD